MLTTTNCKETILDTLCDVPSPLKEEVANAICAAFSDKNSPDCPTCETVKVTSPFYISEGDGMCLSFRDENGVYVTNCFSINDVLKYLTTNVDPGDIASPEQWEAWDYVDRIQAIIYYRCNCAPMS